MDTESRMVIIAGIGFCTGLLLGLGAGLLAAPQAGTATRRHIGEVLEDSSRQVGQWVEDAKENVNDLAKEGKKFASRLNP